MAHHLYPIQQMKAMKKLILLCLCGTLLAGTGYSQGKGKGHQKHGHHKSQHHKGYRGHSKHYVKVRPAPPRYTRVVSPGPGYVYIQDDWRWDPGAGNWVWYGNRWVPAPQPQQVWVPGAWIEISGGGWTWRAGGWR